MDSVQYKSDWKRELMHEYNEDNTKDLELNALINMNKFMSSIIFICVFVSILLYWYFKSI